MVERKITTDNMNQYMYFLKEEEKCEATLEKYRRDIQNFAEFADGRSISKDLVIEYKTKLRDTYMISSANSMLVALNRLFEFLGWHDCQVKLYKTQRKVFCSPEKELRKKDYYRLLDAAKEQKNARLYLLIQIMCATGIRISELEYITVQGVKRGRAQVNSKGKAREVLIPKELCKKVLYYAQKQQIEKGPVFVTKSGKPLNRSNVWKEMKNLCKKARVDERKVFPHNLRHLFARTYYALEKDLAKLADLLGHSSVETTRIYIIASGAEHARQIEKLGLVV